MDEKTRNRDLQIHDDAWSRLIYVPFNDQQYMTYTKLRFPVLLQRRDTDISICWVDVRVEDLRDKGACEGKQTNIRKGR